MIFLYLTSYFTRYSLTFATNKDEDFSLFTADFQYCTYSNKRFCINTQLVYMACMIMLYRVLVTSEVVTASSQFT